MRYDFSRIGLAVLTFSALALAQSAVANGQTLNEPPGVAQNDQFGYSVAIDGNDALVGALNHDNGRGRAHLFDATSGSFSVTFDDPTPQVQDNFGRSVAISGGNVLIGAPGDDSDGSGRGQAHLFSTSGSLLRTFHDPTTNGSSGDQFGISVDIDGSNVLIGAHFDDTNGTNVGQAHLFDTSGMFHQTFNDPTVTTDDNFGFSVAIGGSHVLVGAPGDDTFGSNVGQAHLFDTSGTLLTTFNDPTLKLGFDEFGFSVAIDGNNVLIGAPGDDTKGTNAGQAHLFDLSGNLVTTFNEPTLVGDARFGGSVAIDGNLVLIGAPVDDTNGGGVGQAHLFDLAGNLITSFNDPTMTTDDWFGFAVALNGNKALIGAPRDDTFGTNVGQAHIFSAVPESSFAKLLFLAGAMAIGVRRRV